MSPGIVSAAGGLGRGWWLSGWCPARSMAPLSLVRRAQGAVRARKRSAACCARVRASSSGGRSRGQGDLDAALVGVAAALGAAMLAEEVDALDALHAVGPVRLPTSAARSASAHMQRRRGLRMWVATCSRREERAAVVLYSVPEISMRPLPHGTNLKSTMSDICRTNRA